MVQTESQRQPAKRLPHLQVAIATLQGRAMPVRGAATAETPGQRRARKVVDRLLRDSRNDLPDRRNEDRRPFFRPVSITLRGAEVEKLSAFSREISNTGIGLLHNLEVKPGETVITIYNGDANPVYMRARILWCKAAGEGWYLSAAQFIDVTFAG